MTYLPRSAVQTLVGCWNRVSCNRVRNGSPHLLVFIYYFYIITAAAVGLRVEIFSLEIVKNLVVRDGAVIILQLRNSRFYIIAYGIRTRG